MIAWIVQDGAATPIDDLRAILNPLQQVDLTDVLNLTPAHRRIDVMLAWAGLTARRWSAEAGISEVNLNRWTNGHCKIPFGATVRLARVIGVDPVLLFEAYLEVVEPRCR